MILLIVKEEEEVEEKEEEEEEEEEERKEVEEEEGEKEVSLNVFPLVATIACRLKLSTHCYSQILLLCHMMRVTVRVTVSACFRVFIDRLLKGR